MEELENEKVRYWVFFFVAIIIFAVVGYRFVFGYVSEKEKEKEEKVTQEEFDIDGYIGVWQFFAGDDLPEIEILINIVDGSTITFDYFVKDVAYFDSQTAHLEDNVATFEITDRDNIGYAEGKITFRNDKVFVMINGTDIDGVSIGTYEFSEKSDESLLD